MQKVALKATKREVLGKKVGALRRAGKLPAVLYGHRIETTPITLDAHEAALRLSHLTTSSLVMVDLEGTEYPALVREKQKDYLKNRLLHVDFQVISMTEKVTTKVGIELTGTAPVVKEFSAVIVTVLNELEIECMPQDLPARVVIDISGLTEIGAAIPFVYSITIACDIEDMVNRIIGIENNPSDLALYGPLINGPP